MQGLRIAPSATGTDAAQPTPPPRHEARGVRADADRSLRLSGISKRFRSKAGATVQALRNASVDVGPGEIVSIVGPSGCGKSTLLMIAAGLVQPSSGSVHLGDVEVNGPHPDLGIAFQRDCLLEWRNVRNNILVQVDLRGWKRGNYVDRAGELLGLVGLQGQENRYPRELSGGMRQRVALCRALVHEPKVLLLDEPFGALDALTRERLNVDVSNLCTRWHTAVLFVTHDIGEAVFMGDRVVVMAANPGRVVDVVHVPIERPRDLQIRSESEYARLLGRIRDTLVKTGAYGS